MIKFACVIFSTSFIHKNSSMAIYPHEVALKKYHLLPTDLNDDASEALEEFEEYLSYLVELKKKAGEGWEMTPNQKRKINRLSRAVVLEIEYMVEEAPEVPEEPQETPEAQNTPQEPENAPEEPEEEEGDSVWSILGF